MYGLTRIDRYRSLFDDWTAEYYERVVGGLPPPWRKALPLLQRPSARNLLWGLNEALLPGDMMHVLLRKKYLSDWIGGLSHDCQLLVPGAGFDHLPVRYSSHFPCFAVDLPEMSRFRRQWLRKEGYASPRLEVIDGRFPQQSLGALLRSSPLFSADRHTVVVAEGLFAYMEADQIRVLLGELTALAPDVTLFCTLFSLEELSPLRRTVYRSAVAMAGEPLRLNRNLTEFRRLLEESGFRIEQVLSAGLMRRETLLPRQITEPVLGGFYLVSASSGGEKNNSNTEHCEK